MSKHILIHKTNPESLKQLSTYIFIRLNARFPNIVMSSHNGQLITIKTSDVVCIDFRCGTDYSKLSGVRPDFYYTDSGDPDILWSLEQSAARCNGKKVNTIDEILDYLIYESEE